MNFGTRWFVLAFGAVLVPQLVAAQGPQTTRWTAMSAMRIQEAIATEDDSLRLESYRIALDMINDGLVNDKENPQAYLHLGIAQTGLKNYVAADSAFDRAEEMWPAYADEDGGTTEYRFNGWIAAYNDATASLEAQDPEGAIDLFRSANMLFGLRPEAYLNIGAQTSGLGDLEASIEAWRSAIAIIESPEADPGDEASRQAWDTEYWTMAHNNLAGVLDRAERPEEAIPVYEAILERYPDNVQARGALAVVLSRTGTGDGALAVFDEILAREDGTTLDYFNAGATLYGADQLDRAVIGFEKALARSPMFRDALQNLVQSLAVLEEYEAQVPHSERLLELDPYNELVYQMHARALVQLGRQPDAVAALDIMRELPFVTDYLKLQPMSSGASVSGQAINKTLEPGTTITLRFTFYDSDGNPLGSEDIEVTISDPEVAHNFQIQFDSEMQVLGYGYEFVS